HRALCMQHRLVELPELGEGIRCIGQRMGIAHSGKGLPKNLGSPWLEQPRGDLLGIEPNVALEEAYGCAIGAEEHMGNSQRMPGSDAQRWFLEGFGDPQGTLAMLDCLGAAAHMARGDAD